MNTPTQPRTTTVTQSTNDDNKSTPSYAHPRQVCCDNMTTNGKCLQLLSESQGERVDGRQPKRNAALVARGVTFPRKEISLSGAG